MSRRRRVTPFVRRQNPTQALDSARAWTRAAAAVGVAGVAAAAFAAPASAAPADGRCQAAGIAALKSLGAFKEVRDNGIPIATAAMLGVTVRDGADISGVPDPIPFHALLADHRAGDDSLFVYPWCG